MLGVLALLALGARPPTAYEAAIAGLEQRARDTTPTAAELAALVGLEQVRTVFRGGAKHQAAHEASGLHLWYQGVASSEEAAKQAVASLAALEDRVAIAEIQHEVNLH